MRWYSSAAYKDRIEKLKIPYYPFEKGLEVTGDTADEIFPERKGIKSQVKKLNYDIIHFFVERAPEYYEDIINIYRNFPFDLVIADVAFTAIPFITSLMKIPVIGIGVFPLTEKSKDLAPAGLAITPAQSFVGRIKQKALHYLADEVLFKNSNKVMWKLMEKHGVDHNHLTLFDLLVKNSTILLQSGTQGFEYTRSDLGKNIRFIGPILPYSSGAKKAECFDSRLNQYKKMWYW